MIPTQLFKELREYRVIHSLGKNWKYSALSCVKERLLKLLGAFL
jgi:hypothetical protein